MESRSVRRLVALLPGDGDHQGIRLRQGTVDAINTDRTVDVTIAGSSVVVEDVKCLTSAVPRVGGSVLMVTDGVDLFILGSIADNTEHGYTPQIQHGVLTLSPSAANTANATVTFDWEFESIPQIVCSTNRGSSSNKAYVATAGAVSATSFTARATSIDLSSNSEDVLYRWVAVGSGA